MPRRKQEFTIRPRDGAKIILQVDGEQQVITIPAALDLRLCEAARLDWESFWNDPVSRAISPSSRPILLRWLDALNRYYISMAIADAEPIVSGSRIDNPRPNPHYKIAQDALITVKSCEYQLGIGARNQIGLGMAIADAASAKKALEESRTPAPKALTTRKRRVDPRTGEPMGEEVDEA